MGTVLELAGAAERFAERIEERRQRNLEREAKPQRRGHSFEDAVLGRLRWLYEWPRSRHAQADLREQLAAWGQRRIDRKALRAMAADELPSLRERIGRRIEERRERLAELEARLAGGVCTAGPRRGQPYTESGRLGVVTLIRQARREIAESEQRVAFVAAEPDPLRAVLGWRSRRAVERVLGRSPAANAGTQP